MLFRSDFQYGKPYTEETQAELLRLLSPAYIQGLTLLGGEPFEPENQEVLADVLTAVREAFPKKDIWCYTGYTLEKDLVPGGAKYTPWTDTMLEAIDVLVDGRFIEAEKDISLQFRGSRNQRILHLHGQGE